jgi:predicted esterase
MTKANKILKVLKSIVFYSLTAILLLAISGYVYLYILPKGPETTEVRPLKNGKDAFVMYAYRDSKKKSIRVWTFKPDNWVDNDKIVFVMHGGGRNAEDYLNAWQDIGKEHNLLVIAPEFENPLSNYTTNDYQDGNLFTFFGTKNAKEKWAFQVIENIFDHIKNTNNITNSNYNIFGHSAGGQFVHRMMLFYPESRVKTAIAANPGLYTFIDPSIEYPYGIKNIELENDKVKKAFEKQFVLMTGELDNSPELGTFTSTDLAMKQGNNRLERGAYFFEHSKEFAIKNKFTFNWKIYTVKNVGHDYKKMSESSIDWIKNLR